MCCVFRRQLSLTDADGNVLASGGDFGSSRLISVSVMQQFKAAPTKPRATIMRLQQKTTGLALRYHYDVQRPTGDFFTRETGYNVVNNDTGEIVASMAIGTYGNGATIVEDVCVADNACYYIVVTDSFGDGNGSSGSWSLDYNGTSVVSGGGNFGTSDTSDSFCFGPGCSDAGASNFSPTATSDDGSCEYFGCTDAAACNYNEAATNDDGSCAYQGH